MHYAYPISLVLGGVILGLGLGFIAAAGNGSTLRFAMKEGSYIGILGGGIIAFAWLALQP